MAVQRWGTTCRGFWGLRVTSRFGSYGCRKDVVQGICVYYRYGENITPADLFTKAGTWSAA